MSVVARWREVEGRMPFVRGRLPAAVPAVLGSVLAVATIVWPVLRIVQSSGMPGANSPSFIQLLWSWGRYSVEGVDQVPMTNVAPAFWLAGACLAGALGGLVWLLRRGSDGRVLGAAGVAFALAVVGGSYVERRGNVGLYGAMEETGFEVETLPAGWVELAATLLLVVAMLLMVWRPVAGLARPLAASAGRVAARGRHQATDDEETEREAGGAAPRVGTAVLRDASPSAGERDRQRSGERDGWSGGGSGAGVGFTEGAAEDDRFRPPS